MAGTELSTTTVRYLFASTWAAPADPGGAMTTPGAKVAGLETGASLLDLAVWSLREAGLVDVQQIRPAEAERVVTMGGRSFTRVTALTRTAEPPAGLEGALLAKIAEPPEAGFFGRFDDALAGFLSRDDPDGLRGFILALNLSSALPLSYAPGAGSLGAVVCG